MHILVTGGAGFIGSHVTRAFLGKGHAVTVMDNLSSGKRENIPADAGFVELDIRSGEAAQFIKKTAPDALVHHAAQMDVRKSVQDPVFDSDVNVSGTLNLLEACLKAGTRKIIFASTGGAIYGEQDYFPADEKHSLRPESPYGCAKASVELYLGYYGSSYGLACTSLRYGNVYGPLQDPHGEAGVVAIFCGKMLKEEECIIFGDGKQTRDYVYVSDVAQANVLALEKDYRGPLNIGTGIETDVLSLHKYLSRSAGINMEPVFAGARQGEQKRSCIDASLAKKVLGWNPLVGMAEGTSLTYEHFRLAALC